MSKSNDFCTLCTLFISVQIPYHPLWNNNMKSNYRIGSSENFQCSLHITHLVCMCVCACILPALLLLVQILLRLVAVYIEMWVFKSISKKLSLGLMNCMADKIRSLCTPYSSPLSSFQLLLCLRQCNGILSALQSFQ